MMSCDYCSATFLGCRAAAAAKGWSFFRFEDDLRFSERTGCPEHKDQAQEDMLDVVTRALNLETRGVEGHGHLLCEMAGVQLFRYGEFGDISTRFEVVEPEHVAGFSHAFQANPLKRAINYFIQRANLRYTLYAPRADQSREEGL